MAIDDPNGLERIDQEIRINELKEEAKELADGQMLHRESEDCPSDIAESLFRHVVEFEKAPWTSAFQQLVDDGMEFMLPEEVNDTELSVTLWEIIRRLADRRVFLSTTNHLSDRELYIHLCCDVLHERTKDLPINSNSAHHIDLLSSGSEEDTCLYLKFFANEEWRAQWLEDFPDYEMPARVDPPYDRDRLLPKATFEDLDDD